jgi:hypothetical protein
VWFALLTALTGSPFGATFLIERLLSPLSTRGTNLDAEQFLTLADMQCSARCARRPKK